MLVGYNTPVFSMGVNRNSTVIDEGVVNRFNNIGFIQTMTVDEVMRLISADIRLLDSTPNFPTVAPCEDIPYIPTLWPKTAPIYLYDEWCEEYDARNTYSESLDDFLNEFALKEDDMNR